MYCCLSTAERFLGRSPLRKVRRLAISSKAEGKVSLDPVASAYAIAKTTQEAKSELVATNPSFPVGNSYSTTSIHEYGRASSASGLPIEVHRMMIFAGSASRMCLNA